MVTHAAALRIEAEPGVVRKMLVADLFCGAGGSSSGAKQALAHYGLDMDLVAVNHWDRAIETHSRNHPQARHYCRDIESAKPRELVPEGYLDLLMASPTCTYHSRARGGRPTSDQQRMDPWHVIKWLVDLTVYRLLIENVPEFVEWGPIDPETGRPIKARKGEYFRAWVKTIEWLGFVVEWRIVNCADHGDATTRRRFFMLARSDGKRLTYAPPTYAKPSKAEAAGLPPWRVARDIIDWSNRGRSIFNRKKPLARKTLERIYAGVVKHHWPDPYLVILRNHMNAQGIDMPVPAIAAKGTHIGLAAPVLVNMKGRSTVSAVDAPAPVNTAHASHLALASPFLMPQASDANPSRTPETDPLPTITTVSRIGLVEPFLLAQASGGAPRAVAEPVPAITTGGNGSAHALVTPYYGSGSGTAGQSVEPHPLPTITSKERFGLVTPVTNSGGGPLARSLEEPLATLTTAKGGELAIVMPVTYAGASARAQAPGGPLPTITGAHRGELAFITASFGEAAGQAPRTHAIDEPLPTICATGHTNLVEPDLEKYDILFRMLQPNELAAATSFTSEEAAYEFVGNKTEVIKQIGNAVPVRTAKAMVLALFDDAAGGAQ